MKVQAFMLVPSWKLARASQAFIMASCARSSAAVGIAAQRAGEGAQVGDQLHQLAS